jgi:ATP-dependent helicase/DNAse subunit B
VPLTLVTGPANAAKAGHVLGAYRTALRDGPILVVPTRADVAHYTRELAADGAVVGGEVTAFGGLLREIARRVGYGERKLGPVQRSRLVAEVVAGAELEALSGSASSPGFADAARELFSELERAFVDPQRFARTLGAWAARAPGREGYAHDVARLYGRYHAALDRTARVDDDLFAWRALDALRAAPARWGSTPVFLYGFDDLTLLQRDAVGTLARAAGARVMVSLSYEAGRVAFAGRATTFEELNAVAEKHEPLQAAADFYAVRSRAALHHLERGLFEDVPGPPVDASGAVRLLESGGERAEIELIAAEALKLIEGGTPPERIAVVFRSPGTYGSLVAQVFGAYGVPVAQEWTAPLGHLGLGRAVLGLARAALDPAAEPTELLAYLRSPGLLTRPELADLLEAELRQGSVRTVTEARRIWEEIAFPLSALDRVREAAAAGEPKLLATLRRETGRAFANPWRQQAPILREDELADARAFTALAGALDELEDLAAARSAAPLAPIDLIEALAAVPVTLGDAARPGAVLVADPLGVRARRFSAVFLGGLQEGEFPRRDAPEPFLSEELRRDLHELGGLRLRRPEAVAEERYLFYAAASRAEETVFLSYRVSDEEGNPALPSFFVAEVARLFGTELEASTRSRPLADVVWPEADAPTLRERARARAASAPPRAPEPIAPLVSAEARSALRHQGALSAGALEAYANCPVKWLVERELEPKALEPKPDYFERGNYAHEVLETTLRRLKDEHGSARITNASLPQARALLAEALESERGKFTLGATPGTAAGTARRVRADLERYLSYCAEHAQDGDLEPEFFELAFGFDEDENGYPALELGEGEVRLRGRVDRVDVDRVAGTAVVQDYKSGAGKRDYHGANWEEERQLQVALYMLLMRRALELEPIGGLYQPLRGDKIGPRGVYLDEADPGKRHPNGDRQSREQIEEVMRSAEARAVELAARLRAGELTPSPATCSSRGGCAYPGICRGPGA